MPLVDRESSRVDGAQRPGYRTVKGGAATTGDPAADGGTPASRASGPDLLTALLDAAGPDPIRHVERLPARPGRTADWPSWVHPTLLGSLAAQGVTRPWAHQAAAADLAWSGSHVVIATGTASGKSLAYQLPALTRLASDERACALYLSPTKALAADQLESLESLAPQGIRPAAYDGDTPLDQRDWVRSHARLVLSNPDMLHRGILPAHARWSRMLRRLQFVVVDECHAYRGVFGSHVALVLRRLRHVARHYGSDPVFILASATVADPEAAAARLIGSAVRAVTDDAAPRAGADFVLWEPPVLPGVEGEAGAPVRRSAPAETARILADLVAAKARTIAFIRSRAGTEQAAISARHRLTADHPELAKRVAAYRGGYLPEERRELERALDRGDLIGVASTNALELGVDIRGIDAAVLAGYPGTLASLWQQAGRAGRGSRRALVVFVARDDPLDSYLVHHPESVFGRPIENAVTDPTNPHVLRPHLACAAAEWRLTDDDLELFGGPAARTAVRELVADGVLRDRPGGYYAADPRHPADRVDLRGTGGTVAVVETATGRMLGTEDSARACGSVHPGAVYLHRGDSYLVTDLDLDDGVALVRAERPPWTTTPRVVSTVEIGELLLAQEFPDSLRAGVARVRVTEQVVGYLRRRSAGDLVDLIPLDLPEQTLDTVAVWYTIPLSRLHAAGIPDPRVAGALHAAEHAAIGLLPLFAGCDRSDIGGISTTLHPDTGEPTVLVYDGYPGGAGFAERGYQVLPAWLAAVADAVRSCPCPSGCPSCVQSPKCGNGNHPLDKPGAVAVLDLVVDALGAPGRVSRTAAAPRPEAG
jgi:DEAD/DEAH box helicase domain-containing protein